MEKSEKRTPNLYFSDGIDKTSKGYEKIDDSRIINKKVIGGFIKQQIKKEIGGTSQPKHSIDLSSGKLQIQRPSQTASQTGKFKKETSSIIKRTHTGIPGLDEVMEGGFKSGTLNMVGGGAGSGKSIFCMQFLVEGARKHNENGVYISFEQPEHKILNDFERFNWNLRELIEKKRLVILYYSPEQVQKVLQTGGGIIRDVIESINAKRLVLDSLTAFTMLFPTELEKRKAVLKLMEASEKWGVTTLMTSERDTNPDQHESSVVEFEADGVILLYNIRKGDVRERSLEVFKMRGTRHAAKIFPMKIYQNGIMIYPEETVF